MKRTMTIILTLVVLLTTTLPVWAGGPGTGPQYQRWERVCLSSGVCRFYAAYSYDNYRWFRYDLYPQMRRGYNTFNAAAGRALTHGLGN
jgi:hypothetical protein